MKNHFMFKMVVLINRLRPLRQDFLKPLSQISFQSVNRNNSFVKNCYPMQIYLK
jgi:hypothetical protein